MLLPTLTSNKFNNNSILPIYLFGTSYPTYVDNTFSGYIDPADKLGVGLGGEFNGSGTLTIADEMPFVFITPMEIKGSAVTVTIPAGAVFKGMTRAELAKTTDPLPGLKITGGVNFEATEAEPIIFTSYRDDSVGGDTNGDGIDIDCCADVTVSDCLIQSGDDCITLRGNAKALGEAARPCEHVVVQNCVLSTPCNAIRIGVGDGVVRDCSLSNIIVKDSRTGISIGWFESSSGRGMGW